MSARRTMTAAALAAYMHAAGSTQVLLVLTDPDSPQLVTVCTTADGQRIVLGMVDTTGDDAVVSLERDAVQALADRLTTWLEGRA